MKQMIIGAIQGDLKEILQDFRAKKFYTTDAISKLLETLYPIRHPKYFKYTLGLSKGGTTVGITSIPPDELDIVNKPLYGTGKIMVTSQEFIIPNLDFKLSYIPPGWKDGYVVCNVKSYSRDLAQGMIPEGATLKSCQYIPKPGEVEYPHGDSCVRSTGHRE